MQIDIQALSEQLGCPVIPMVSTKASGIDKLKDTIDSFPATKENRRVTNFLSNMVIKRS